MVNRSVGEKLTERLPQWRRLSTLFFLEVDETLRRVLPGRCAFCLGPADASRPWCSACFSALPWNHAACPHCAEPLPQALAGEPCGRCLIAPPAFGRGRAPLRYEAEVAGLMRRFKFHASPRAGAVLLALLEAGLTAEALGWPEAILPVPLHPQRARERGFDQAGWLARRLARRLGVPLVRAERHRDTPSQRGLDRDERRRNVQAAFRVEAPLPARVALLDDVMTTGATLNALALACRRAGARELEAWAVARTPLLP